MIQQVLNAISQNICLLDFAGEILTVNSAWNEFGAATDAQASRIAEGVSYVGVCERAANFGDLEAATFAAGLRWLLGVTGTDSFELEYPCHSPTTQRQFLAHAQRVHSEGPIRIVVEQLDTSHARLSQSGQVESEEHYRVLFQTSIDGVLLTRPDGSVHAQTLRTASSCGCRNRKFAAADGRA